VRRACLWFALGFLSVMTFGPSPAQAAVTEAWVLIQFVDTNAPNVFAEYKTVER
jgi:hypothetical protein